MLVEAVAVDTTTSKRYCINHRRRETNLRCGKCLRPICPDCAVRTEVGYRCTTCTAGGGYRVYKSLFKSQSNLNLRPNAGLRSQAQPRSGTRISLWWWFIVAIGVLSLLAR